LATVYQAFFLTPHPDPTKCKKLTHLILLSWIWPAVGIGVAHHFAVSRRVGLKIA
jgi:hypothetical protein